MITKLILTEVGKHSVEVISEFSFRGRKWFLHKGCGYQHDLICVSDNETGFQLPGIRDKESAIKFLNSIKTESFERVFNEVAGVMLKDGYTLPLN